MNNQNSKCYDCNHEKIFHNERGSVCGFSLCDCVKYFPSPTTSKCCEKCDGIVRDENSFLRDYGCLRDECPCHTTSKSEDMTDRQIQAEWKEQFEPRLENWEAKLGQLTARAWQKGLWHSESELSKSLKSFISTLLQEERGKIIELAKECYEDVGDGGDPYVAQRNVGVAMVIGKIQQQ